jgi:hypothetical protein
LQSAISTVLLPFAGSEPSRLATVAEKLSVFRVLRVLKLVMYLLRLEYIEFYELTYLGDTAE